MERWSIVSLHAARRLLFSPWILAGDARRTETGLCPTYWLDLREHSCEHYAVCFELKLFI